MYEIIGKFEGETNKYKIEDKISLINWQQMQIKKSYELVDMVNIFHKKINGELESQYDGYILGWNNNRISVFIPEMDKKVFKFCINLDKLENILEKKEEENRIIWKRKDANNGNDNGNGNGNGNVFIFEKYMKIKCKIVLQKNRYEWQNKVSIEVIEPNFSDFLLS
jgi:hypothetical protein